MNFPYLSGYQDSNLGPPAPKAGALAGLRYTPNNLLNFYHFGNDSIFCCRGTRIRTWDPLLPKQVR